MVNSNLEMLRVAAENLGDLKDELVFVGGCTTELFITDEGAAEPRQTKDVDAIVEASSYTEYINFSEKLKAIGFNEDTSEDAPLCRWVKGITILDVMPLDEESLGFTNRWYRPALETAENREFITGYTIKVVSPVYFCATKMEAFHGRGNNDYLGSHDLEDIIAVIDGREEIAAEIKNASDEVRQYITGKIISWLKNDKFLDALPGHLGSSSDKSRLGILLKRSKQIAN
ncbi:MAG: hypothetical protein ACR2MD_05460 [Aridibacter sp.]